MMRRIAVNNRKEKDGAAAAGPPQLVAVAVDADKSSQHALKWAADHLLSRSQIFFVVHVRRKITSIPTPSGNHVPISEVDEEIASAFVQQIDFQTKELLLPFQCFCSRRGLQCKEVILEETDVSKAIVNFVMQQSVDKLVLGASSRSALIRAFKSADVPTSVSKAVPEFCSVYVISKGKISSIRPAPHPNKHPVKSTHGLENLGNQFQSVESEPDVNSTHELVNLGNQYQSAKSEPDVRHPMDVAGRSPLHRLGRVGPDREFRMLGGDFEDEMNKRDSGASQTELYPDFSYHSTISCPSPSRTSLDRPDNYHSRDFLDVGFGQSHLTNMQNEYTHHDNLMRNSEPNRSFPGSWSSASSSSGYGPLSASSSSSYGPSPTSSLEFGRSSWSNQSALQEGVDSDIRKLKLELMEKMDMYNSACNEVVNAKKQAQAEKADVDLPMKESHFPEGAAVIIAEKEKERCKGLLEAAQVARRQKMMNIEGSKKMNGENKLLHEMVQKRNALDGLSTDVRYRKYTTEQIQKATDNFSDELKIGEGGYGPVFKATLDHTPVAIKILRPDAAQGIKQFQQEIEVLSCIRHPNMVLLMGACPEYGCLVYEYMANGSLEDRLFCQSNTTPLSWPIRFKIAAEVATGLLFLHQTKPEPLVHRDLKPANILLDHSFVSRIADVGLARLLPPSVAGADTQYHMTAAAGTFCYIDPEYQQSGLLGVKSDIYAFGIILLQLITAAPPMGLAHNVENAIRAGKLKQILDPNVPDWPMEETMDFARLALNCAELRRRDRPDLASVILPKLNRLRVLADGLLNSRKM